MQLPKDVTNDAETCSSDIYRLCLYISKVHLLVPVNELFNSQIVPVFAFFNWIFNFSKFLDGRCYLLPFGRISSLVSIKGSTPRGTLTHFLTSVCLSAKTADIAPCSTRNDYNFFPRYKRKFRWMRRFVVRPVVPGVSQDGGAFISGSNRALWDILMENC